MDRQTLQVLLTDPAAFRSVLLIDVDGEPRPLVDVIDEWQDVDFRAMDLAWQRVCGRADVEVRYRRAYLERPRGHSKTADLAVAALWALFAARGSLTIVCAAADKDQARLLRYAIERLMRLNPWLNEFIDCTRDNVRNRHNGAELTIISSEVAGSWGLTPDAIIVDELSHWDRPGLWHSLVSAAAKRPSCILLVISNAGHGEGTSWQWQARETLRGSANCYFHSLNGPVASWITDEQLAEQRRLLPPKVYQRLWGNVWTLGADGDAIPPVLIDQAVTQAGPLTSRIPGWLYVAGLDIGTRRDRSALLTIGIDFDGWKLRLVDYRQWKPSEAAGGIIDPAVIRGAILELDRRYGLHGVAADSWQGELLASDLERHGIWLKLIHPTVAALTAQARATLRVFQENLFTMWRCHELIADLQSLRIVERPSGGGLRLSAPRTADGHADAGSALSVVLPGAIDLLESGPDGVTGSETTFSHVHF